MIRLDILVKRLVELRFWWLNLDLMSRYRPCLVEVVFNDIHTLLVKGEIRAISEKRLVVAATASLLWLHLCHSRVIIVDIWVVMDLLSEVKWIFFGRFLLLSFLVGNRLLLLLLVALRSFGLLRLLVWNVFLYLIYI